MRAGSIASSAASDPGCARSLSSTTSSGQRIRGNAEALGVPGLEVLHAEAPDALVSLPRRTRSLSAVERPARPSNGHGRITTRRRLVVHAVTQNTEMIMSNAGSGTAGSWSDYRWSTWSRLVAITAGDRPSRGAVERSQGRRVTVHFIGAGPGAADLLTIRAVRLIESSPVCVYAGTYVDAEILAHCPPDATLIDSQHLDLDQITDHLVIADQRGTDVARLCSVALDLLRTIRADPATR